MMWMKRILKKDLGVSRCNHHFQYTLLPFPSELLYLGLGYEEGRELPHQSAKCVPINEGDLFISTNAVHLLIMQNHVIINTIPATGTTSTTATFYQLLTLEKIKQPSASNCILI